MAPVFFEYEPQGSHVNIQEMPLIESDLDDDSNVINESDNDTYLSQGKIWDDHEEYDESSQKNEITQSNNRQGQMKDDNDDAPEDLKEELIGYPNMYENDRMMNGPALKQELQQISTHP